MCQELRNEVQIKYLNNTEDCLYLGKGFLVCSVNDRYREKVTKTETNDDALKRYFTNVDLPSKRRKPLFVVKKGGSRSFQLHFTYTDGVFVTRSNCQLLFPWHQS